MSLIERLKAWAENYSANRYPAELMAEAAARIETLEAAIETNTKALGFAQNGRCAADARIEALETALKPFADAYHAAYSGLADGVEVRWDASFKLQNRDARCEVKPVTLRVGDFHRAASSNLEKER